MATIPQTIKDALTQYNAEFRNAHRERQQMAASYGYNGQIGTDIVNGLLKTVRPKLESSARTVQAALKDATNAAESAVNQARNAAEVGPEGQRYLQALAAFQGISRGMSQEAVAQRLAQALDSGLHADARAWADVARSRFDVLTHPLAGLVQLADTEAVDPGVQAAQEDLKAIQGVDIRFGFAAHSQDTALMTVVQDGASPAAVGYSTPYLLGEDRSPNTSITVS